jgi:site-specific DNA-methyltransferase (adenine-specific)
MSRRTLQNDARVSEEGQLRLKVSGGPYRLFHCDAFEWLDAAASCSIEAVVTDPPYGLIEYSEEQLQKRKTGKGGVWRIPPSFDGCQRAPLPRFTVLSEVEKRQLREFFVRLASRLIRVLVPGAHVFIATNPLVSHLVYEPFLASGFEKRGEIMRLVQTLRGGDRPKNAEHEFEMVTVMPRACWEPWGLFRKPCEGRVQDTLRKWRTGGLRRISKDEPFKDVIESSVARNGERAIAAHPSLKPQHFMRQIVRASLPFDDGTILDPFMGSGSTIAAATACGLQSVGLESNSEYFEMAVKAIPLLAALPVKEHLDVSQRRLRSFGAASSRSHSNRD